VRDSDALLDLKDAEKRITSKTRAIMPVHYASSVGNLDEVYEFAAKHKLRVVEDAAHAFGCEYHGKKIGSFGDIVCFSFDGIKNITSGEGGAVVTRDPVISAKVQDARLLGVQKDTEKRFSGQRSWDFDVAEQGWRYHMSDIMAAIGRTQLKRFESEFKPKRIKLTALYRKLLSDVRGVRLLAQGPGLIVPHIFPIRLEASQRDKVRAALQGKDVQLGIHYRPNHLLTKYGAASVKLPVVEKIYEELVTLPLHPEVSEEDVEMIASTIRNALSG
jgi:dTDP-4-amino-4,6-dideoxygalactose transaminase